MPGPILSPPIQRFAAVGLTFAAVLILLGSVILPGWNALLASAASLRDARFQLARLTRQVDQLMGFDARAAIERRQQLEGYTIAARSPAEAQAALEGRLRELLSRPGLTIERIAPIEARSPGAVRTTVRATAQERAFTELLGSTETGLPLLTIEALDIQTARDARRDLALEMTVTGYWSPRGSGRP